METQKANSAGVVAPVVSALAPPAAALKQSARIVSFDRSAVLVHALGLVALGLSALVAWILGKAPEALQVQAVGGAAAVMLFLWSVVLAFRSFARGQKKHWSLTILILFVLECGGTGFAMWNELLTWGGSTVVWNHWGMWLGVAAFGPPLLLGTLLAGTLGWLRARRAARNPACDALRARRLGLRWFAAGLCGFLALTLPFSFYLSCAAVVGMMKGPTWQAWVVKYAPDSLKRASYALLAPQDAGPANTLRLSMILGGELPEDVLERSLDDAHSNCRYYAREMFAQTYPRPAEAYALACAYKEEAVKVDERFWAGWYVATRSDDAVILELLADYPRLDACFLMKLAPGLLFARRDRMYQKYLEAVRKAKRPNQLQFRNGKIRNPQKR